MFTARRSKDHEVEMNESGAEEPEAAADVWSKDTFRQHGL